MAKVGSHAAANIILGEAMQRIDALEREQYEHTKIMDINRANGFAVFAVFRTLDGLEANMSLANLESGEILPKIQKFVCESTSVFIDGHIPVKNKIRTYELRSVSPYGVANYIEVDE